MITVLGIGPGNKELMTIGVDKYLEEAEIVIGSKRQLSIFPTIRERGVLLPKLNKLKLYLRDNINKKIVLLASGDPLLYGIGNWITQQFPQEKVHIVPAISSIQYFFHQLRLSMNDVYLTSSHGRITDFDFLLSHKTIGMVTDKIIGPYEIAQAIKERGQHRQIYIGEMLSYPEEKISVKTELTVERREYLMNVVIISNA